MPRRIGYGVKKPDTRFFAKVQATVALSGQEILLIDDSAQNIEAARLVGWQAFLWTSRTSADILRRLCDA